ncbi:MAG: lipopolysaccharide transport system ATP-binding protein [Frankiales bacterium]|nr:lipopolysaccharide transport system ATP-binding protein [Frankiales bacterium]
MADAIEVSGVSKRFRLYNDRKSSLKERVVRREGSSHTDFWALRDISLSIAEGSTFGLIGHNGSGKSTFLKLLAGIHRPTTGDISVRGRVSALLELGAGFHPELSGRDNILLNGAILGLGRKQILDSLDRIIEFSGLEPKFIDSPVKVYSSGMYVRLGFSIAVNLDPEILIIDEIVAVGDEEFQRRCFDHLYELRKRGVTICFVSHSLPLVQSMCDQVAWFDHGHLRAVGPAVQVVDQYLAGVNSAERERFEQDVSGAVAPGAGRRGSGEVLITAVEFLGSTGTPVRSVGHGEPLTVRIHYAASSPVPEPVFGLAFINELGHPLAGPNTLLSEVATRTLEGEGSVDFAIPAVRFVPGEYEVTAAITDHSATHTYDHRDKAFSLHVQPGPGFQPSGLVAVEGWWSGAAIATRVQGDQAARR